MTPQNLFTPRPNQTQTLAVTTGVQNVSFNGGFETIRLYNGGTAVCFVELGGATAAVATSMPIAPGAIEIFSTGGMSGAFQISVIGAATTTLYLTPGMGA